MRKWLNSSDSRVQFSIPDFEWEYFTIACCYYSVDPWSEVSTWALEGRSSSEIRALCRARVLRALHHLVNPGVLE